MALLLKTCERCNGTGATRLWYWSYIELWQRTPASVWAEYKASGYTLQQAIAEEIGYWN